MCRHGRTSLTVYPMSRNNHSDKCHFISRQMSHSQALGHQQAANQWPFSPILGGFSQLISRFYEIITEVTNIT
jgi:hypothetical protein